MGVLNSADIAAAGGATAAQLATGSGVSAEALVGGAKAQVEAPSKPRNIGQFTIGSGRFERVTAVPAGTTSGGVSSTARTWQIRRYCPLPFDAIRVGIRLGQTSTANAVSPVGYTSIASVPSLSDADLVAQTPAVVLWGGAQNPTYAPSAVFGEANLVWSDWTRCPSVPVTDGRPGAILVVRTSLWDPAGGNIITMGDTAAADSFANWATHPTRPYDIYTKSNGTFGAPTSWANMTIANSAIASTCPQVIFQALYRGMVINLGAYGDSIYDGRGTYLGESFGVPTCVELSAESQINFEWSNFGWSGQNAQFILRNIINTTTAGLALDAAFVEGFFTNNVASGIPADGTTSVVNFSPKWMDGYFALMLQQLDAAKITAITGTGTPANYSVRPWGAAGDARRLAHNNRLKALAGFGRLIADFATPIQGPVDGNGQQTITDSADGIHPNDAGYIKWKPAAKSLVRRACLMTDGLMA